MEEVCEEPQDTQSSDEKQDISQELIAIKDSQEKPFLGCVKRTLSFDQSECSVSSLNGSYTYLMIASPAVDRKLSMERMSSFISSSSGSNTENSAVPGASTATSNVCRSKYLLLTAKSMLKAEIKKIDEELDKMENEKMILLNLRNFIIDFQTTIRHVERNKQNIPSANKMCTAVGKMNSKAKEEAIILQSSASLPFHHDLTNAFLELQNVGAVIVDNKTALQIMVCEDLVEVIGTLFGMIETILLCIYDEGEEQKSSCHSDLSNSDSTSQEETAPGPDPKVLSPGKNLEILRTLSKNASKAKKIVQSTDRLSSGTPKTKSLQQRFQDLSTLFEKLTFGDQEDTAILECSDNLIKLKNILSKQYPAQKHLERFKFLLGELAGRLKILLQINEK